MKKFIVLFIIGIQCITSQRICKSSLPLQNLFGSTRNFTLKVDNFPDDDYMAAFFINFSIPILTIITSVFYILSFVSFDRKCIPNITNVVQENRRLIIVPYVILQTFVAVTTILLSWHLFDMLEKGICHLESSSCVSDCIFESTTIAQLLPLFIRLLSWKPLFIGLSVIVSTIPLICLLLHVRFFTILVLYFILSTSTSILGFFLQQLCGLYIHTGCNCAVFDIGMTSLCKVPLYELSIFICISNMMLVINTRNKKNKQIVFKRRATIHSTANNLTECIDLPNNSQYNYKPKVQQAETTREKWYSIVG